MMMADIDYKKRLVELAIATKDERPLVYDFIENLVNSGEVDEDIYITIFNCIDDLKDEAMPVFNYMLENKATKEWYDFVSFLCDQRGDIIKYFDIIKECYEKKIPADVLNDIDKDTSEENGFIKMAKDKIDSQDKKEASAPNGDNEYLEYLKLENERLNLRIDAIIKENALLRVENKEIMDKTISGKRTEIEQVMELERLRKEIENSTNLAIIAKRKHEQCQDMVNQLSNINDRLSNENMSVKKKISQLSDSNNNLIDRIARLSSECEILKKQVAVLQDDEAKLRIGSSHNSTVQGKQNQEGVFQDINDSDNGIVFDADDYDDFEDGNEAEEVDYNKDDVIEIRNGKDVVKSHTNIFATIISGFFDRKFERKNQAEQDGLIYIKLLENGYSEKSVRNVRAALTNVSIPRIDIYRFISNNASDDELDKFIQSYA
jgi:hypothetical protein